MRRHNPRLCPLAATMAGVTLGVLRTRAQLYQTATIAEPPLVYLVAGADVLGVVETDMVMLPYPK